MKKIYLIQTLNLKNGSLMVSPSCFQTKELALEHVQEIKRIYSEMQQVDIDIIDERYVFNVLALDLF